MKCVALFSGGKDSTYAVQLAKKKHEVAYLISMISENPDSYMFHTPNVGLAVMQSVSMRIPVVTQKTKGEKEKEVKDLEESMKMLLEKDKEIKGVVCGAVESQYQKTRIEKICKKLKLKLIAPLWHKKPEKLLAELLKEGYSVIITAVAAHGFDKKWLGRQLDKKCVADLKKLNKKYKVHMTGEGGEYETLVLDCPMFVEELTVIKSHTEWKSNSGKFIVEDAKLQPKGNLPENSQPGEVASEAPEETTPSEETTASEETTSAE